MPKKTLRLILGDQLSDNVSALRGIDKQHDTVLMMEVIEENTYVPHHPKKLIFILSAMRHFAASLREKNISVDYIQLDNKDSKKTFTATLKQYLASKQYDEIITTEASEYRVLQMQQQWQNLLGITTRILEDDRFIASKAHFQQWAQDKKQLLLENYYRLLRKETGILMQDNKPVDGQWNFDKDNRKAIKGAITFPQRPQFNPDDITIEVIQLVTQNKKLSKHFGNADNFNYAVTRKDAGKVFTHFIKNILPQFGDYQDAMQNEEYFLYHSVISHYLNIGFLDPRKLCIAAENAYHKGNAPINAVEGFIRQILGWREFIRGIYWLKMPDYVEQNFFNHQRDLPDFYWGAKTDMLCISHVVKQTQDTAYSHHIQRLMVTGNFALLAELEPQQVHAWYLAVYADAYEWAELPNTLGMALFADGGVVGSKPYAASGAYIKKMSNFCKSCRYKVQEKNGEDACPFNYLYWNFFIKQREKLGNNHRLGMVYRNIDRFDADKIKLIKKDSQRFLNSLAN